MPRGCNNSPIGENNFLMENIRTTLGHGMLDKSVLQWKEVNENFRNIYVMNEYQSYESIYVYLQLL